jgi:hypothetical protein
MTQHRRIYRGLLQLCSLAALVGGGLLLLGDSADPNSDCEITSPFTGTYDVITTCNGEHSGRVTITATSSSYQDSDDSPTVEFLSGDISFDGVAVETYCGKIMQIEFTLPFPGNGPDNQVTCHADTNIGTPVACDTGDCTLQITPVP